MEGPAAFAAAFLLISIMELGDKTQLLVISLSTKHPMIPVAAGAALGVIAVTAIGVAIGIAIATAVPILYVRVLSGALFIGFGVWALRPEREESESDAGDDVRNPFLTSLGLAFVAELGDKTMIAVIALSGSLAAPVSVFAGASLGLVAIVVVSVGLGRVLRRYVTARWLRYLSAGLFLAAGIITIVEALLT
jgi:putative Ca2+/H+ antiporter (TMEM165/GDT1 family)